MRGSGKISEGKQQTTQDFIEQFHHLNCRCLMLVFRIQKLRMSDWVKLNSVLQALDLNWIEDNLQFCQLQVKCLCVLMFLSFPLSMAEVPGPCRHSITREHLLVVRQLVGVKTTSNRSYQISPAEIPPLLFLQMDNQLRSGCSITYTFIEQRTLVRKHLSKGDGFVQKVNLKNNNKIKEHL